MTTHAVNEYNHKVNLSTVAQRQQQYNNVTNKYYSNT